MGAFYWLATNVRKLRALLKSVENIPYLWFMKNRSFQLSDRVNRFIAARKELGDVSAVLIYGSYARGTQHEQSDVDIILSWTADSRVSLLSTRG